ncbi:LON peptidase substrate-binding domain-containing protein [Sediminibacterium ginsengisoli]|uniref:Lon N-terminal domain-containing protein n=1 Tax=Sediminibacterium ginsengisoli TaxID=413434 RepID=A0A1T4JQS8_9BACT|nr:LON peptidase substrate-binding domain-containing protein [Sediminibacterium ginsengisoli]SJZ32445.1 hypothetical protein SAMN04488132_10183 [Sediminibacterium ginsengisoli]
MTNFIPIFPLGIVVYPGEYVNLHIFEDRYKQLVNDCHKSGKPFGIPVVVKDRLEESGTLVSITEIVTTYPDGKMDIRIRGEQVFNVLEVIPSVPDKLYQGAIVSYPANSERKNRVALVQVLAALQLLHKLLGVAKDFKKKEQDLVSYDLAHHAGLALEEEYELLCLLHESQRLEYLKRHLDKALPMLAGMEDLKERIKLNGHFRELKGFNFGL